MPHVGNTPESLVSRTDSLNPATTCRGITASGRPCRRPLASSTSSSPSGSKGVKNAAAAALFCWQHKDQAASVSTITNSQQPFQMKQRTSIDTLMERLGVMELNDTQADPKKRRDSRKPGAKKQTRRTFCCCFEVIEETPVAPRPVRPAATRPTSKPPQRPPPMQQVSSTSGTSSGKPQRPSSKPSSQAGLLSPAQTPSRPSLHSSQNSSTSQTNSLLAWIPSTLSPQTTSLLLTELAKPISDADEPGYIYMFWVTPQTTTRSLLSPSDIAEALLPPAFSPGHTRGVSDALQTARDMNALTSQPTRHSPGGLRLKIGRTSNVHRRMNEWTRQCAYDLTLIRYYPYTSSTQSSTPMPGLAAGRKVPHVHRVERLIHLELGDIRLRDLGPCEECGKEHREWFEVPAEKVALKRVDDCIRRWVQWAESQ